MYYQEFFHVCVVAKGLEVKRVCLFGTDPSHMKEQRQAISSKVYYSSELPCVQLDNSLVLGGDVLVKVPTELLVPYDGECFACGISEHYDVFVQPAAEPVDAYKFARDVYHFDARSFVSAITSINGNLTVASYQVLGTKPMPDMVFLSPCTGISLKQEGVYHKEFMGASQLPMFFGPCLIHSENCTLDCTL